MRRRYDRCSGWERRPARVSWFIVFFLLLAIFFFNYFGKKLAGSRFSRLPPSMVFVDARGRAFVFEPSKENYTLLLFVTDGCDPCSKQIEELARLSLGWVDKVVVFLDGKVPQGIVHERLKVYTVHPKETKKIVGALGVDRVPTTFIIDNRGFIRRRLVGFVPASDVEAFIKAVRRYGI